MAQDITEILFDACQVRFGAPASEVDLGFTDGPVVITFTEEFVDVVADQTGKTKLDQRLTGQGVEVKLTLKQISLDILTVAFPSAATAASGIAEGRLPGWSAISASGQLILHPQRSASAVSAEDFRILKAVAKIGGDIQMGHETLKGVPLVFTGLADISKLADGDGLWEYGNYA